MLEKPKLSRTSSDRQLTYSWISKTNIVRLLSYLSDRWANIVGKVLEQFGRYPSRNDALGRKSTPEEEEHLKKGTGWDAKEKETSS